MPLTVCGTSGELSAGSLSANQRGEWKDATNALTFTPSTAATTTVSGIEAGAPKQVTWTVYVKDNDACYTTVNTTIQNTKPIATVKETNVNTCDETYDIEGYGVVDGDDGYTGKWEVTGGVAGAGFGEDNSSATTEAAVTIKNLKYGDNIVKWTLTSKKNQSCFDEVSMHIVNNKVENQGFTNTVTSTCDGTIELTVSKPANNITGKWETTGEGTFGNTTEHSATGNSDNNYKIAVSNMGYGLNVFTWTLNNECANTPARIEIYNNQVKAELNEEGPLTSCDGTIILSAKDNKSTYVNSRGYWSTNSKKDYKYGAISAESSTITAASSTSLANVKVWDIPSAGETFVWTVVDVIKVKDEDGNETEVEKCPVSKSVTVKNCNIAATIETTDFDACNGETTIYAKNIFSVNGAKGSWQLVSQPSEQVGQVQLNSTGVDVNGSVDANKSNKLDISNMTASGSYKFKWNVEYNDNGTAMCPLTAEFTVRNNSLTTKADRKGPDASVDVCGDSYTLSATDHGTGYQGKWTDENGNALVTDGEGVTGFRISDPSSSTATVYGIPSEDTPIKWTVTKMITRVKVGTDGEPVLDENDKPVYETVATTCSASDVVTLKNEKAVANAKTTTNPICDGGAALTSNNVITSKLTGVWEKSAENQMGHFVYNGQTYDRLEVNSDNAAAVDVRYEGINNGNTVSVKWTVNKTVEGQNCASDAKVISLTNNGFDLSVNGGTSRRTCDNTAELTGNKSDNCTGWWTSDGSAKFVVAGEGENTTKTDRVDAATVNVVDLSNDPAGNSFTWHVKSNACPERSVNFMIFNDKPTASIFNADKLNNSVNCDEKLTINAAPLCILLRRKVSGLATQHSLTRARIPRLHSLA